MDIKDWTVGITLEHAGIAFNMTCHGVYDAANHRITDGYRPGKTMATIT